MKETESRTKVLVTGAAGFIGLNLILSLLESNYEVIGLDNINSYYDINLKYARLNHLGIKQSDIKENQLILSNTKPNFKFIKLDISDRVNIKNLFNTEKFDIVINLAGQAGVRYSIENPFSYLDSNIYGFLNILENCRHYKVKHFLFASSSSVYGVKNKIPYSESDETNTPVSLYAATKKSDELMAYSYSKLFGIATTGLRFFTVYGPWGRPDMAPFMFMQSILNGKEIKVFNHGNLSRDFTYIDDIVSGIKSLIPHQSTQEVPAQIFNLGNSCPVKLLYFISVIEKVTHCKANKKMVGMQPGDVYITHADISKLQKETNYEPKTSIEEGLQHFYEWFINYHK